MHNLFILTFLIMFFSCTKHSSALRGGWKPIPDVTDPTVVSVGKFAIHEHNKESHASLKFAKVIKGDQQLVAGMNYNLTITAADGGADKIYVTLVWDKPWEKFRKLVSFKGPI